MVACCVVSKLSSGKSNLIAFLLVNSKFHIVHILRFCVILAKIFTKKGVFFAPTVNTDDFSDRILFLLHYSHPTTATYIQRQFISGHFNIVGDSSNNVFFG